MFELRSRHYAMLHYIADYTSEHGQAPLLREIAERFECRIQTVTWYIETLEDRGMIERTPFKRRGLQVKGKAA